MHFSLHLRTVPSILILKILPICLSLEILEQVLKSWLIVEIFLNSLFLSQPKGYT